VAVVVVIITGSTIPTTPIITNGIMTRAIITASGLTRHDTTRTAIFAGCHPENRRNIGPGAIITETMAVTMIVIATMTGIVTRN